MGENIFTKSRIQILDSVDDWKEAIKICAKPLLDENTIKTDYVDSIIEVAENIGPFFDIGKQIAMPHSRPENGVIKKSVSLLKLEKPVYLLDLQDHPIKVIIVLAAENNTSHMNILGALSDFLIDDNKVEALKNSKSVEEIYNMFNVNNH